MTAASAAGAAEVRAPADRADAVCGDLVGRRGRILDLRRGDQTVIMARVPLAGLFGYRTALVALAGADAHHTMRFDRYEPITPPQPPDGPIAWTLRLVQVVRSEGAGRPSQ